MADTFTLARRLKAGETVYTGWCGLPYPLLPEIIAREGFPAVTLDGQHGLWDTAAIVAGVAAVRQGGAAPVVRVPVGGFASISRALDFGAEGIIAPMISTVADAKAFVSAAKFPPLGERSWGPTRAMALAGEFGDGLVFAIPPRGIPVREALARVAVGAARAGRRLDGFRNCALTNIALLEPGERADSERVLRAVGPNVMASVYYFYDEVQERGIEPPEFLRPIWKRYCALVEDTPAEYRHFRTHEFHYTYLHPGEVELIDAGLIRATCLVGTAEALVEQVRELEREGLQELMFAIGVDEKWRVAEAFARGVIARM